MKYYFRCALYYLVLIGVSSASAGSYEDYFQAVRVDDAQTVSSLLERGFDPNSPDERGQVGLYLALRDGSLKVAAALLAHPELKVDATNGADETPLMMAALRGNLAWTQRLLERGALVNRQGWTPLHYAASGPETKLLSLLLDRGALIEARSPNGTTALMMAARYGVPNAAEVLLARGADPKARNDLGLTAADFARQAGREALAAKLQSSDR